MEQLPPLWVSGDCDCSDRIGVDSARPGTEGALEECLGFSFAQVSAQNRGREPGAPGDVHSSHLFKRCPPNLVIGHAFWPAIPKGDRSYIYIV